MAAGSGRSLRLARRDLLLGFGGAGLWALASPARGALAAETGTPPRVRVERFEGNPIIRPGMDPRMGSNVQGPSLIRVPSWIAEPLGRYYLYFADHKGSYIRLAYADRLEGPWRTHEPGSLQLAESLFPTEPIPVPPGTTLPPARAAVEGVPSALEGATLPHIASPDAHVREDRREIALYYHGLDGFRSQHTRVATSKDGIHFTARPELLGSSYFRAFAHRGGWYAVGMPGVVYRSADGLGGFEQGPTLFKPNMRHCALLLRGDTLHVFWTRVGDAPEHVLLSTIDVSSDWSEWKASEPIDVLFPEHDWEGADRPLAPSIREAINVRVRQLRDPTIFAEAGRTYLLYSVAGESGIAIAELFFE